MIHHVYVNSLKVLTICSFYANWALGYALTCLSSQLFNFQSNSFVSSSPEVIFNRFYKLECQLTSRKTAPLLMDLIDAKYLETTAVDFQAARNISDTTSKSSEFISNFLTAVC